jgi:hypothetical protein
MRTYHVFYSRPGGFMNWPGHIIESNAKVGVVVRLQFRKWFGEKSSNDLTWHKDGFMGNAYDNRGNSCEVTQLNGNDGFQQDLTRPALPWRGTTR